MRVKTGIGIDSHRIDYTNKKKKPLVLGGVLFKEYDFCLEGNSDADVVLHALTNSISSITGINILGDIADKLCKKGIKDSSVYLHKALEYLKGEISNISISIEAKTPKITPYIDAMKIRIAELCKIKTEDIGITATSGEGLTEFGRGKGIQVISIITVLEP